MAFEDLNVNCRQCSQELQPGWKLCPYCGTEAALRCGSCSQELQPGWKLCPFCGTSPGQLASKEEIPSSSAAVGGSPSALYALFSDLLLGPPIELLEEIAAGPGEDAPVSAWLRCAAPERYEAALEEGFARLRRGFAGSPWEGQVEAHLEGVFKTQLGLVALARPAIGQVRASSAEVRALKIPDSAWHQGLLRAGEAMTPTTEAGLGAVGGAVIGNFIFPGVGGIVGGALGAMAGGSFKDKRIGVVIERWGAAVDAMPGAFVQVCEAAWDNFARSAGLPSDAELEAMRSDWQELAATLEGSPASIAEAGRGFMAERGESPEVVQDLAHYLAEHEPALALPFAEDLIRLVPWQPGVFETAADVAFAAGDGAQGVRWAEQGLLLEPEHQGLRLSRIQCLARMGRDMEAEAEALRLSDESVNWTPLRFLCRGRFARGKVSEAAAALAPWVEDLGPELVALQLREDPVLAGSVEQLLGKPMSAEELMKGLVDEALGFVVSQSPDMWLGRYPGGERGAELRRIAGRGKNAGQPLFVADLSSFDDGKSGFVLTTMRVCWKENRWADTVRVKLDGLDPDGVLADDWDLQVGGQVLESELEGLTETLALLIRRLVQVARR